MNHDAIISQGGLVLSRIIGEGITIVDRRTGDILHIRVVGVTGKRAQLRLVAERQDYIIMRDEHQRSE
jgi:sRNA-binding carbon storage regulator CsrA